jgi:hypothetical protein
MSFGWGGSNAQYFIEVVLDDQLVRWVCEISKAVAALYTHQYVHLNFRIHLFLQVKVKEADELS